MSSSRVEKSREWKVDSEDRNYTIEELVVVSVAKGVQYGWDCSTNCGYGDEGDCLNVDEEDYTVDDEDDDAIQLVEKTAAKMATNDTNNVGDIETKQLNKDLYPPLLQKTPKWQNRWRREKSRQ